MKPDLTLSEAFELHRKDVIVYKNQSAKTEEMNQCAMKSIVAFLGDIPIAELEFDQVRKWTTDLLRNNANIVYVKELLGHASIQVTMTYTHVVDEDLHQIHRLKHTVIRAS